MIDLNHCQKVFCQYVNQYDKSIGLIQLKIVHTFKVVEICKELCSWLKLNEEETSIALLISLLHDLGRFEQYRLYQSFEDYKTIDHALLSSYLLFEEGMIRWFIEEDDYDEIIKISIEQHNKYRIDENIDKRTLLFVHLIRDADKLDNFRVKESESIETLFNISLEELQSETISEDVYQQFMNNELIYAPIRNTHLDMWISYIAFIYDLYFKESVFYIDKNNWIERSFSRIKPIEKDKYDQLKNNMKKYVKERIGSED